MPKFTPLLAFMLVSAWHDVSHAQQDPLRARDSMVYLVLIDALSDSKNPHFVLLDSTVRFALPDGESARASQAMNDSFPPDLVAKLVEQSRQPRSSATLPLGNRTLITRAQLTEIFRKGPDGWSDFYSRYPDARGSLRLSPVVWSSTGNTALLYFEWSCGGLCGGAALLLVERTWGKWRITRSRTFWVS